MLRGATVVVAALLSSLTTEALAQTGPHDTSAASASLEAAQPAAATLKRKKRKKKRPARAPKRRKARQPAAKATSGFSFKSSAGFGFQHGYGVRRFDSPVTRLRATWAPWRMLGPVRVELPLDYQLLSIPDAELNEYRSSGALKLSLPLSRRLEPFASVELTGVWRPNWPDLYQPLAGGGLMSTDRFSYWQRQYQVGAQSLLGRATKARARYTFSLWDYRTDPAFRPVDSPNHLPPSDHDEHAIELSIGSTFGAFRPRASLLSFQRSYFFVFARDRRTGKTHAGPGGLPANPLYVVRGAEPELSLAARMGKLTLRGAFGVQLVDDVFQGYYSSIAQHPALSARWLATERFGLELGGELWLRRYGPDSYAPGPGHPALAFGERRVDRMGKTRLEPRFKIAPDWSLAAPSELTIRRTNFPAYEPGIFPRSRQYSVDWSYDNWQVMLSVEYRPRQAEQAE